MSDAAPQPPSLDGRIAVSLDAWKRKLLDLTKRNRALNFKATRTSTILIADEQPSEVFRRLYLEESSMTFAAVPPAHDDIRARLGDPLEGIDAAPQETPGAGNAPAVELETALGPYEELIGPEDAVEVDEQPSPRFAPYERSGLAERHKDNVLQTASDSEHLDRALRRLDVLARSSIDEQGVNTLFLSLGMLEYLESDSSTERFKAPLILLPVELKRKSARAGYTVQCSDDDPMVNPALAETLRRSFGIELPELPDAIPDDYDLQGFLGSLQKSIKQKNGWAITNDIALGQFSFQKFVMYKDLEVNSPTFTQHRLIRQIVGRSGALLTGLPAEVRDLDLDTDYPPERTFQVVDADSSQVRAIAAVALGHDLVLEGPPGTGKSQTITNLIAQALAAGKSVLFVAEKMAALQVVHDRLRAAGLDEFCLEMHSTKANKRLVIREIGRSLDASLQSPPTPSSPTQRLAGVRTELSAYASAVHEPYGALAVSPYRAYAELEDVLEAPIAPLGIDVHAVPREQLDQTVRDLDDVAATVADVGDPAVHPWRDCGRTYLSAADLESVRECARELIARLDAVAEHARTVESNFEFSPIHTFADIDAAAAIAGVLARSPGAPVAVLQSDAWNAPPAKAQEIIDRGRRVESLRGHIKERFASAVLTRDHGDDAEYVLRKSRSWTRALAFLDGRHREIVRRWRAYRLPSFVGSLVDQAAEMQRVDDLRRERSLQDRDQALAHEYFGDLWKGEGSSWEQIEAYVAWVVEFRGLCVQHGLHGRSIEVATRKAPDVGSVNQLREAGAKARDTLTILSRAAGWPEGHVESALFTEILERARGLAANAHLGPRWVAFETARQRVVGGLAAELLSEAMRGEIGFEQLSRAFRRAFFQKWLDGVVAERAPLRTFHSMAHEQRVGEFRHLDRQVSKENRAALVASLRQRTQQRLKEAGAQAGMPFLRKEMARQRGLSPLRRTLREAEAAIRAIKPCFMMSPLTVAQCLPGSEPSFDIVIFDEASQLPPEDSVGAILRGNQLVVVGDSKQLPPTNFFAVVGGQMSPVIGDDGQPLFEDSESILEEFSASGAPKCRLRWHYRSAHESLIMFSNVQFYDSDLNTFPSVETGSQHLGLRFEFVPDGVYEGSGLNRAEAHRVVDAIVEHAKMSPDLSLGVGTFSMRQQLAVLDEIEKRRRNDPDLEDFFAAGDQEGFFVKNLENIQGDERDVIYLSVTYAKGADGKLRYQFGPLNAENGWRRLNVLTTRARKHMRVFSSIRGDDINVAATSSRGAKLIHDFLVYAELGRLDNPIAIAGAQTESPFETQVMAELGRRGLTLVPQVGAAGYRIDFGVLDEDHPGRYVCGIECDGVAYHSSETARDRDRLRQQVLEDRGWIIHRIWSTDWFKDRDGQIGRILDLIGQARERLKRASREGASQAVTPAAAKPSTIPGGQAVLSSTSRGTEIDNAAPPHVASSRDGPRSDGYVAPSAAPYRMTPERDRYVGESLLDASTEKLLGSILAVVENEGPIHEDELLTRVAGMWGNRAGSRIVARIRAASAEAERSGRCERRNNFLWPPSGRVSVRSRAGLQVAAEHICPEEYREAALAILETGYAFNREDLRVEVRALLGFSRTGHLLEAEIDRAIQVLLDEGIAGEASGGIGLRG